MKCVSVCAESGAGRLAALDPLRQKGARRTIAPNALLKNITWSISLPTVIRSVDAIMWSTSTLRLRNAGPSTVYDPSSPRKGATCTGRRAKEGGKSREVHLRAAGLFVNPIVRNTHCTIVVSM